MVFPAPLKVGLQPTGQYRRVANPARAMLGNLWPSTYIYKEHHRHIVEHYNAEMIGARATLAKFLILLGCKRHSNGIRWDSSRSGGNDSFAGFLINKQRHNGDTFSARHNSGFTALAIGENT